MRFKNQKAARFYHSVHTGKCVENILDLCDFYLDEEIQPDYVQLGVNVFRPETHSPFQGSFGPSE
jgi:hypothetical protein